ncbi:MAG: peptidoglycan DD-metalloendopeptidase family protein [Acidobacteria bacterium]|nr:peptidoglycan DD-metalloendopeptidase family protein [Acidobacteriota bacterium]
MASISLGGVLLTVVIRQRLFAEGRLAQEMRRAQEDVDVIASHRSVYAEEELPSRTTFSEFLERAGFDAATVGRIIQGARPVYDLSRVRAGNQVTFVRSGKGELRSIHYQIDLDRVLWITKEEDGFRAEIKPVPYEIFVTGVTGRIEDSLFQALADRGEQAQLALEIADIFGWDIDFYTDPRRGDTFEVVVEKKILSGELLGYGRVLAAQYQNEGTLHQAVLFRDPSGRPAYYAPDGKSMKKAFLRSPLKFSAAVTSGFSRRRFHPILKHYRPHLGIDYGAPVGSPVQAVADGRVVSAGWKGGGGKTIHLRHAMGYETTYMHLSRIRVRAGQRVSQGQAIGLTGATGLATGPHLDFRVKQHGKFRNFLSLKLPPAQSVAKNDWAEFVVARTQLLDELASLHRTQSEHVESAALADPQANIGQGK